VKEISWTDLKQKTLSEIKEGECLRVTGDGEMVFYAVVGPQQVMKDRVEAICQMIDVVKE